MISYEEHLEMVVKNVENKLELQKCRVSIIFFLRSIDSEKLVFDNHKMHFLIFTVIKG